jgi:hypothetical protein
MSQLETMTCTKLYCFIKTFSTYVVSPIVLANYVNEQKYLEKSALCGWNYFSGFPYLYSKQVKYDSLIVFYLD